MRIVGPPADGPSEVVDPLAGAPELDQSMTAMVTGLGVSGIVLELRGVSFEERLWRLGEVLDVSGQRSIIDLERGQRRGRDFGRVVAGIGRRIPVEAHRGKMGADGPQVPDVHGRAVSGAHDQPRPVGAEGRRPHTALIRAFQPRDGAARLILDQADHPAGILDRQQVSIGRKRESTAADLPRFAPGFGFPEPAGRVSRQEPFSVGAELNADKPVDLQMRDTRGVANSPDLGAGLAVAAGYHEFRVRTDGH